MNCRFNSFQILNFPYYIPLKQTGVVHVLHTIALSKEVYKSNFRQYGQMKSRAGQRQREEESKRRSEKRKGQKKADADARKGRKVAKHCVLPVI